MGEQLDLDNLENWLYEAANILRGPVDQADFKAYIFPLLFFKRISDVFDEEREEAIKVYGEDFQEDHRFKIPEGCHWQDIRETSKDVGQKILESIRNIEKENPDTLYGIFGDTQWSNKNKLSDKTLVDLIEHFSKYNLGNSSVKSNTMGKAYEFLIKKFADDANKKAGEFYTPREVVKLMTMIVDPKEGNSIYDPACGTGGMLLEAIEHVREIGGEVRTLKLYGQELNLTTSSIARINMFLHNIEDFNIVKGDTLNNPVFFENDELKTFDIVIANPPFSLKQWGYDKWTSDPYGRNIGVNPPESNGDYAWVLHMLKSLDDKGKMAVVLPQGVLFRKAAEGKIRKQLLKNDWIETIIGLAPNLFYGTNISASILIFNKNKDSNKKGKVQFIDASEIYKKDKAQNYLTDTQIIEIFQLVNEYADKIGKQKIAELADIKTNDYNLNIPLYVEPIIEDDGVSLEQAYNEMIEAYERSQEADKKLEKILNEMGVL